MRQAARSTTLLFAIALVTAARVARADDAPSGPQSHLHVTLGAGHAIGEPQSHELGWGGQLGVAYELRLARVVGFELGVDATELTQGNPPTDPRFAAHDQGFALDAWLPLEMTR